MTWRNTKITLTDGTEIDLQFYNFIELKQGFMCFKWANLIPRTSEYPEHYLIDRDKILTIQYDEG